jgi:hypothetical protein
MAFAAERAVQGNQTEAFPKLLGFRAGASSVHTSRTMMLAELSLMLERIGADACTTTYWSAIVEDNVLGKPTQTTRQRTAKRLVELYALDPCCTVFRLLRHFWSSDPPSRPMLAFLAATARDPLLRHSTPFLYAIPLGHMVSPTLIAAHLHECFPGRFQTSTAIATAQRLASTWRQAGYLRGRVKKQRITPHVTPMVTAFALVLGYLCGLRGTRLLDCLWTRFLHRPPGALTALASAASQQGWLTYKVAGAVVEITFPGLLQPLEERLAYE